MIHKVVVLIEARVMQVPKKLPASSNLCHLSGSADEEPVVGTHPTVHHANVSSDLQKNAFECVNNASGVKFAFPREEIPVQSYRWSGPQTEWTCSSSQWPGHIHSRPDKFNIASTSTYFPSVISCLQLLSGHSESPLFQQKELLRRLLAEHTQSGPVSR